MLQRMPGLAAAAVMTILSSGALLNASPARAAGSPFMQCPAIGSSPSCEILLTVNQDGSVSVQNDSGVGPYDGSDDTLVGITNNSNATVDAVTVNGPGTGLSGFDGDGICNGVYGSWNGSAGCPYGPIGYEGPGTSLVTSASQPDSAEVDFSKGLTRGATAYFSLEGALASANLTAHKGHLDSFTVTGSQGGVDPGSQDTHSADPTSKCNRVRKAADGLLGRTIARTFAAGGGTTARDLLLHFLGGSGSAVKYGETDLAGQELVKDPAFTKLNNAIVAAVVKQLDTGNTTIDLTDPPLQTVVLGVSHLISGWPRPFTADWDLYWGFRGTQSLSVSGTGNVTGGNYVGTITYVVGDNYGFPAGNTFHGIGPQMRYLQVNCGGQPGGSHWFPDSITVSEPFKKPAGPIWATPQAVRPKAKPDQR